MRSSNGWLWRAGLAGTIITSSSLNMARLDDAPTPVFVVLAVLLLVSLVAFIASPLE